MREATFSPAEIARFNAMAARWWDPSGPMRALHRMNPARVGWITEQAARAFPGESGLRLLDVGCGAGLACEALARSGFDVLGIDAAVAAIEAARAHASDSALSVRYRVATPEELAAQGLRFPIVTALEVIEHVPDPRGFLRVLADITEPRGLVVLSTLNRTARSFLAAKVAAEYLLHWLPIGTHDWRRFMTPRELSRAAREAGFSVAAITGLTPDILSGRWCTGPDVSVNYLLALRTA